MRHFHWTSLLLGIVALIAAVIAFRDPAANLMAVTFLLGAAALVRGVFQIAGKWLLKEVAGLNPNLLLALGILNVVFGLLLLTNLWVGMLVLPMLFALWFILDSLLGLMNAGYAKRVGNGYFWFRVIAGVLGVVVGVFLFLNPVPAAITLSFLVGIYFMILSILCFTDAFSVGSSRE